MANLTITAYWTRQGIKWGTISLLLLIFFKTGLGIFLNYWRALHPPPPPPPDVGFGQLPPIRFPQAQTSIKPTNFVLDTIEGKLPELPTTAKVYFMPTPQARFLALQKAQQLAQKLGFDPAGKKINEGVYQFRDESRNRTLTVHLLSQTFTLAYPYLEDQTLLHPINLPSPQEAINIVKNFLNTVNKLTAELERGNYKATFWRVENQTLINAPAISEADFLRIDVFRPKIQNEYPILPPKPNRSLTNFLLADRQTEMLKIVYAEVNYLPIDQEKFATYPLYPLKEAWEQLKRGNYYLASLSEKYQGGKLAIKKIFLAYFDQPPPCSFLQPIYVFQGEFDFWGYFPAVAPEWISE